MIEPADLFADRYELTGESGSVTFDSTGLTKGEPFEATDGLFQDTAWFKWTAPANGTVTFDTLATTTVGMDTVMYGFSGSSLGSLTTLDSNDDDTGTLSLISFSVTSGVTYSVQVGPYTGTSDGLITLSWSFAP
jgi:hypothetical protein